MARRYEPSAAILQPGTSSAESSAASQLADTLSTFRRTVSTYAANKQTARGAAAGAASEGTPKTRSNATAFGRAYNNSALRRYVIEHYVDVESQLARAETEAGNDPDKFRAIGDGIRKGAVAGAIPDAKADIAELYTRRIAEGVTRLEGARAAEQRQMSKAVLQQGLDTVTDSISRKLASGVPAIMAQAEEEEVQYQLMIDGAVASGDISPAEGLSMLQSARKAVTRQMVTGEFERQLREGDPIGFIGSVMAQPVENLSDEEKTQVVGQLFERMNRWQALLAEQASLETDEQKARWREGERNATVAALKRSITLDQLANMVARDELDPAVGRTLANELQSPAKNVDDEALKFQVETNLLRFTEEEIAGLGGLSHGTRADLILKRRQEAETWKGDQGAQEALRRIDVALGIPAGPTGDITLALDPEKANAAAKARTLFYNLVEETPADARKGLYFELADRAVSEYGKQDAQRSLERERAALASYQQQVGDPTAMDEEERKAYDEVVTRRQKRIADLEAQLK